MLEFVNRPKRGGSTAVLGPRLVFSRQGADLIKAELQTLIPEYGETVIKNATSRIDDVLEEGLGDDEDFYILYLDANNLYGTSQYSTVQYSTAP